MLIAVIPFLVAGAVSDWRTRSAPNQLWVATFLCAALGAYSAGPMQVAAGAFGVLFGWLLFRLGAGGADAKALMAIGLVFQHPLHFLMVLGAALPACLVWAGLVSPRQIPFLVPLAASVGTWVVLGAWPA